MKKIAVIGVTESVGREILAFLADGGYRPSDTAALETKVHSVLRCLRRGRRH